MLIWTSLACWISDLPIFCYNWLAGTDLGFLGFLAFETWLSFLRFCWHCHSLCCIELSASDSLRTRDWVKVECLVFLLYLFVRKDKFFICIEKLLGLLLFLLSLKVLDWVVCLSWLLFWFSFLIIQSSSWKVNCMFSFKFCFFFLRQHWKSKF